MMSKLYKAVDKEDPISGNKCWLVNEKGVAVSYWGDDDGEEIEANKRAENSFLYSDISRFEKDALSPLLIAEW